MNQPISENRVFTCVGKAAAQAEVIFGPETSNLHAAVGDFGVAREVFLQLWQTGDMFRGQVRGVSTIHKD
jgi:hypothetical protein